jgi:hypothetical protein
MAALEERIGAGISKIKRPREKKWIMMTTKKKKKKRGK